ncbi:hypothetical protein LXA43DRAFT_57429 [Ganoderma leucocontextum]|nr:hypothetical protein LXA43DRAFT_57429 [Ganoderma leucocontextum]
MSMLVAFAFVSTVVKTNGRIDLVHALNGGASSVSALLDMRTGSWRRDASRRGTMSSPGASRLPLDHSDSEGSGHETLISFSRLRVFGPWRGSRYIHVATLIVEYDGTHVWTMAYTRVAR